MGKKNRTKIRNKRLRLLERLNRSTTAIKPFAFTIERKVSIEPSNEHMWVKQVHYNTPRNSPPLGKYDYPLKIPVKLETMSKEEAQMTFFGKGQGMVSAFSSPYSVREPNPLRKDFSIDYSNQGVGGKTLIAEYARDLGSCNPKLGWSHF